MPNIRLPLQDVDSTGDIKLLSGYVVALRVYPFTSNAIDGVEASDALGYYDFEDVLANVPYQLWAGTSAGTMERNYSFSGDDGKQLFGTGDETLIDPADGTDNQIMYINPDTGLIEWISLADLMTEENINSSGEALPYYVFGAYIVQDNAVSSGKARVSGVVAMNTIADGLSLTKSFKISTGIYALQFRTAVSGTQTNKFATYGSEQLDDQVTSYYWNKYDKNVWHTDTNTGDSIFMGTVLVGANFDTGVFGFSPEHPTDHTFQGIVVLETRDANGDLADNVLEFGTFIQIQRFKQVQ